MTFGAARAAPGLQTWLGDGAGTLLGAFATDIGDLNEVLLLRNFDSPEPRMAGRRRAKLPANPRGCVEYLVDLRFDSCQPSDLCLPVVPGRFGPVHEFRTRKARLNRLVETRERLAVADPDPVRLTEAFARLCDGPADYDPGDEGLIRIARDARLLSGAGGSDPVGRVAVLPVDTVLGHEMPRRAEAATLDARTRAGQALAAARAVIARAEQARRSSEVRTSG